MIILFTTKEEVFSTSSDINVFNFMLCFSFCWVKSDIFLIQRIGHRLDFSLNPFFKAILSFQKKRQAQLELLIIYDRAVIVKLEIQFFLCQLFIHVAIGSDINMSNFMLCAVMRITQFYKTYRTTGLCDQITHYQIFVLPVNSNIEN